MGLSEGQPRKIFKTTARIATLPIMAAILGGCNTFIDSDIPGCDQDSGPKTKIVTLFPDAGKLSRVNVDGMHIEAVPPAGTFEVRNAVLVPHDVRRSSNDKIEFHGSDGRDYVIEIKPYTDPKNNGKDGAKVTIQADCPDQNKSVTSQGN